LKLFSFLGGIHPPARKEITENMKSEECKQPKISYISLLQHIGVITEPLVKKGEIVKKGQRIAESKAFLSAPIHSPVSGKVIAIESYTFPVNGKVSTIIIENDFEEIEEEYDKIENYKEKTKEELLIKIRDMGIVGQGGAAFPTHVKLSPPADSKIDTLIINGAECEPYLNSDNRVMIECAKESVEGIKIMMHILKVEKAVIGIENNKKEAIESISKAIEGEPGISIALLAVKYPQGGEKQMIKAILNRVVPVKKLPSEVGVVVQNISTAYEVYRAIVLGKPLIERVVTVSGRGVASPKNMKIRIGTLFKDILEQCGFNENITEKIIMGGPMMGIAQFTKEVPTVKGTSGILALTNEEINKCRAKSCIGCGKCIEACPMNLTPLIFAQYGRKEMWKEMDKYNLMDCIECGSCAFICPAKRPLTEAIKIGKAKLRAVKK
jgi:Na+-translocating ferredoxin:NAD+ oxidoreductase subunit C